ncbi:MAG: hypothetical protein ABSH16_06325 [Sedimentisphaerales bacterium]
MENSNHGNISRSGKYDAGAGGCGVCATLRGLNMRLLRLRSQ